MNIIPLIEINGMQEALEFKDSLLGINCEELIYAILLIFSRGVLSDILEPGIHPINLALVIVDKGYHA
jgi:hypothetical protein